ncbi:EVE domain-containing protein [Heyndrickxia oleronia]|uniref:AAA family ATPase n=1 Tax=Heyndrickxia oleronia TaxID=38875 RepID=UPI0020403D22|nr:AAA family ATPase [Heyndrickxia oleronia]MCM3239590.1 EVE domain-containing protein [Heyndrickxia oleronia]
MANWIFQGNPKVFDVDTYILENDVVEWSVRQKQYLDEIKNGDNIFIWRSDGGDKNTGGIIAFTEAVSDPFEGETDFQVRLKILERRLSPEEGMLLRHELKEIPETMNLLIFKMRNSTNYRLSDDEYKRILSLWKTPNKVKEKLNLSLVERYLHIFRGEAAHWFEENEEYLHKGYEFFEQFKQRETIKNLEWEEIQELGEHINAFRMGLAKKRALGFMNAPIEHYQNSFEYLIYGNEPINERIDRLILDERYKLFGFGGSAVSELIGNIFPEEYCFYNQRDKVAVENILELVPNYLRGDSYATRFMKFQECLKQNKIVDKYLEIVGKQTDLPIYYEIDQFFSFLFEAFGKSEKMLEDDESPQYWLLGAGEGAFMWEEFYQEEIIGIGWEELGDLRQYNSLREIAEALKEAFQLDHNPTNDARANYQFMHEMKIGDYVFIKKGIQKIIAYGKIVSDYKYESSRELYHSIRKVEWITTGEWDTENDRLHTKTLTDITPYEDYVERLLARIGKEPRITYPEPDKPTEGVIEERTPYNLEELLAEVFINEEKIEEILETLDYKKNIILQGPPGVGKTFVAKRLAFLHSGYKDDSKIEMVQFHQSYSYEDFIRGYKPNSQGNFTLKDGIFYTFCEKAINDQDNNYYMIIDEINRGNLSKIFGELMMLIESDKRGKKFAVKLAYSEGEETFYIPKNLYLIGTMNTADRSLAMVDYALRRRFSFVNIDPAFHTKQFNDYLSSKGISQGFIGRIVTVINEINQEIINDTVNLGKGYEIGHSYFCPTIERVEDEQKWFDRIIRLEIAPLLREYWFDQEDKVDGLLDRLT